ncbi:hypothetical protein B0H14DRAFT_2610292 [Mycena olivaceomarginata]|nr:hypothetical protein B0H14DRAFT_2610292 [Mycena olivaceomarginata]
MTPSLRLHRRLGFDTYPHYSLKYTGTSTVQMTFRPPSFFHGPGGQTQFLNFVQRDIIIDAEIHTDTADKQVVERKVTRDMDNIPHRSLGQTEQNTAEDCGAERVQEHMPSQVQAPSDPAMWVPPMLNCGPEGVGTIPRGAIGTSCESAPRREPWPSPPRDENFRIGCVGLCGPSPPWTVKEVDPLLARGILARKVLYDRRYNLSCAVGRESWTLMFVRHRLCSPWVEVRSPQTKRRGSVYIQSQLDSEVKAVKGSVGLIRLRSLIAARVWKGTRIEEKRSPTGGSKLRSQGKSSSLKAKLHKLEPLRNVLHGAVALLENGAREMVHGFTRLDRMIIIGKWPNCEMCSVGGDKARTG